MSSNEDGQRAITQLNGSTLGDQTITLNEARERQSSNGSQRRSNYHNDRY